MLKGGHNNFGIITRFDMRTFEAKDVFDGDVVFSKAAANDVIDAYVDFSTYLAKNPDSHVLAIWFFMPKSEQHIINLVLTNLDGVENPKAFEKFMAIPGGQPNLKKKSIARKVSAFLLPSGRQ